jgi:hypothetical protein
MISLLPVTSADSRLLAYLTTGSLHVSQVTFSDIVSCFGLFRVVRYYYFLFLSFFFGFLGFGFVYRSLYTVGPSSPEGAQLNVRGEDFLCKFCTLSVYRFCAYHYKFALRFCLFMLEYLRELYLI